ncbi:MAG: M20 family metallo-hydrolase [Spirochaetes bacterium]|nr:M20 family metallo-hydrolase [Spirochaetota bacterium]
MDIKDKILKQIESHKTDIISFLKEIIRINSINPRLGGPGEKTLARFILDYLSNYRAINTKTFICEDLILGNRYNILASLNGRRKDKCFYIVTHMDTVGEGDIKEWKYHPFEPIENSNRIFGLGSETKQSITTGIFTLIILDKLDILPEYNLSLLIVSDEETGSEHGIKFLFQNNIFNKDDMVLVLDSGSADGAFIEIAEKSVLWLKIEAFGKQTHSSNPLKGKNSTRAIINFANELINFLYNKYNDYDKTFENPYSSFEPTYINSNIDNFNTIPGYTKLFIDCRILPVYDVESIISEIKELKNKFEQLNDIKLKITFPFKFQSPPPLNKDIYFIKNFTSVLKELKKIDIRIGGHGKLTTASFFRINEIPAIAWCTNDNTSHQPNEYCYIKNLLNDIFTLVYFFYFFN